MLIADASRFEGVRVIGVDEHVWRRTPHGDKVRHRRLGLHVRPRPQWSLASAGHGPRPIPIRSSRTWLATRPQAWREGIEIVAMDGFTGFKSAAASLIPCTRRGVSCTPDRACSPLASSTRFLICSPVMSTSQSKSLGASTRTSSTSTASPTGAPARLSCKPKSPPSPPAVSPPPHRDHQAGKNAQTRSLRHPGLLRPPPHLQRPHRSHQTAASNTYAAPPSDCATSPTTSPEHYSKPADSDPNYTPNYEERLFPPALGQHQAKPALQR